MKIRWEPAPVFFSLALASIAARVVSSVAVDACLELSGDWLRSGCLQVGIDVVRMRDKKRPQVQSGGANPACTRYCLPAEN